VTWYLKPWCLPGEIMTDMYYPIYAEGLYDALMQVNLSISSIELQLSHKSQPVGSSQTEWFSLMGQGSTCTLFPIQPSTCHLLPAAHIDAVSQSVSVRYIETL
jgi:hypothetical protein